MKNLKVSVIVPAYNEERNIRNCLSSLLNQSYKNFEIIVVDDGSRDKTREIVKEVSRKSKKIKLIRGRHKGAGAARNLGVKSAKGKILLFPDADMTFDRDYIKQLIKPIIGGKAIGCEDGKQVAINKNNVWSRCWGTFFKPYIDKEKGQIFRAILKSEFQKMGGFDSSFGYADDLTFFYKYGVESLRVKGAICYHRNPETLKEVFKQSKWIGASLNQSWIKIPILNAFILFFLLLTSPLIIIFLSIKKLIENKDISLVFHMIVFMTARYFGTLYGIFNRIFLRKNIR